MPTTTVRHSVVHLPQGAGDDAISLLFIAGAGSSTAVWPEALWRLPHQTPRLLDLPGHGDAKPPGRRSIAHYANDVVAVIRSVAPNRVVLVGHSMGAVVALAAASLLPGAVDGLIMIGASSRLRVSPALFDLLTTDFPAAAGFISRYGFSRDADPALTESCVQQLLETGPLTTTGDFLACHHFDGRSLLADITVPVCVISGDADRLVRPADAAALAVALPNGAFVTVPGAGHFVMQEQPEAVAQIISTYLQRLT